MKKSKPKPDPGNDSNPADRAREAALRLLTRREHSAAELHAKLLARGLPEDAVAGVLATLAEQGLQSDARFAEHYVRSRTERGYGPVRIRAELRQRGVDEALIDLDSPERDWGDQAEAVRRKRFGDALPADYREQARQMRFLEQRGFSREQIRRALRDPDAL